MEEKNAKMSIVHKNSYYRPHSVRNMKSTEGIDQSITGLGLISTAEEGHLLSDNFFFFFKQKKQNFIARKKQYRRAQPQVAWAGTRHVSQKNPKPDNFLTATYHQT